MHELTTTKMEWDDLVLRASTVEQLREIESRIRYGQSLSRSSGPITRSQQGASYLFSGPSGTGKTSAAIVLGKTVARPVHRVGLSAVVSKYIGETEKNLDQILSGAQDLDGILLFDEADALFGTRTEVSDAHDRYANQEVAYLLQRIETFPGIVIFTTNSSKNIDNAYLRRFQAIVQFFVPNTTERRHLWEKSLQKQSECDADIDELARQYELTGGEIVNAVLYASLQTREAGRQTVHRADLIDGIRHEVKKRTQVNFEV